MENHFATYNQSLALKGLGFDEPCFRYIYTGDTGNNIDRYEEVEPSRAINFNHDSLCVSQPLKSQVFEWFREKHNLFGSVETDCTTYPKFCYVVKEFFGNPNDLTEKEWGWKNGLYSVLYRSYHQAENELIDYLISIINPNYEVEYVYEGYMSQEAQEFFKGNIKREEREGCATVGSFITLENGKIHLPSKGDIFVKREDGTLTVKSIHR
jgi:hypothetical protein